MLLEKFLSYLRYEKRFSSHTFISYKHDIEEFATFLSLSGEDYVSAQSRDVRSWLVELMEDERKATTIGRKLSALRSFYKFLLKENLSKLNPALLVRAPKLAKKLPLVVDEARLNSLLDGNLFGSDFKGISEKIILELLFGTGMRLSELLTLKESAIDFSNCTLKVLGKRNKERIIPFNTPLGNLMIQYIREKKKEGFDNNSLTLIVTSKGRVAYRKYIYRVVNTYLGKISTHTKRSPHVLRHTFATSLLNNGADINAIKELLGHSSLAATQVYTHNSVERLKSVYKQAHPKA